MQDSTIKPPPRCSNYISLAYRLQKKVDTSSLSLSSSNSKRAAAWFCARGWVSGKGLPKFIITPCGCWEVLLRWILQSLLLEDGCEDDQQHNATSGIVTRKTNNLMTWCSDFLSSPLFKKHILSTYYTKGTGLKILLCNWKFLKTDVADSEIIALSIFETYDRTHHFNFFTDTRYRLFLVNRSPFLAPTGLKCYYWRGW